MYITISSDSEDEPVRFVPNTPVVVRDDDEEDEVSILEVTGFCVTVHKLC